MSSFGVVLLLTLGIGYLATTSLNDANNRMQGLYQEDMKAVIAAETITIDRLDLARQTRDAIIHINEPAIVTADMAASRPDLEGMQSSLQALQQSFHSKEGIDIVAELGKTLPGYQQGVVGIVAAIQAGDVATANTRQSALGPVAAEMSAENLRAGHLGEQLAEEKFQTNKLAYQSARIVLISACLLALAFGVILSFVIARGFSMPLANAVVALEKVAGGDLTVSLDVYTHNELGQMATALNDAVAKLNSTLRNVADSAANASSSSQQLASASEAIASGAQEQAASLEETSASLEEITATVRQSADNAKQASQLAAGSKDSALQGQEVVDKAIAAMSEINVASAKISDIISTIDEIAFQTNLLAVNAAVEAARAGDEGRGFAVVASEVRSLAQRSAVAAKEIKVLIQDTMRKVDAGSKLVSRSGETLQGIVGSVKRVTDIVGEIAAAANEQSTGIEQVNTAMTQMDQVTQSNSAQTEELSATAESLSEQAARLLELVSTFTLDHASEHQKDQHSVQSMANRYQQSNTAAVQPAKAVRTSLAVTTNLKTRGGKNSNSLLPALAVAIPNTTNARDASFQEF
jgi:methyl-accepting chemotaxis protein